LVFCNGRAIYWFRDYLTRTNLFNAKHGPIIKKYRAAHDPSITS
jgi:hypothetical protein